MPRKRTRRRKRPRSLLRRLAIRVGLPLLLLFVSLLVYIHFDADRRFRERMDRFPSRIYSSGLVLAPGGEIPQEGVEKQLKLLGYRKIRGRPENPGDFRRGGRTLEIFLRNGDGGGFTSPVRVTLRRGRVRSILDRDGEKIESVSIGSEVLGIFFGDLQEDRLPIGLDQAPWHLRQAILTMEDRRFYRHPGIDPVGIGRAFLANIRAGRIVQGGSTITQQLAKNLYGSGRRGFLRKIFEMVVAMELEFRFTKDEIFEAYLNDIYMGQRGPVAISGVGAAAEFYFGKRVDDLALNESALLAGMIRSPGNFNPRMHLERSRKRRDLVLASLESRGWLTSEQAEEWAAAGLGVRPPRPATARGSYLTDFIRRSLAKEGIGRPLPRAGLRIVTTVEPEIQAAAETALARGLERLEASYDFLDPATTGKRLEGCIIVTRPSDGTILALVGGRDYRLSQFNRADRAHRQPGSLFKPFVYLTGFEEGAGGGWEIFTPATLLDDSPLEMMVAGKTWQPQNYDHRFRGKVPVRYALERSLNVPTVRAAQWIGLEPIVRIAKRLGIESRLLPIPSLALGSMEVTPLEMAGAFSTIANGGRRQPIRVLLSVSGPGGDVYRPTGWGDGEQVVSQEAAFLVTDILRGVVDRGTGRYLRDAGYKGEVAGKTGTSDATRDAWFVGYTPEILALVWVGFDDGSSVGLSGSRAAAPIWGDFMKRSGWDRSMARFRPPHGVIRMSIDPASGEEATWRCPERILESFIDGTEPDRPCSLHSRKQQKAWKWIRDLFER